MKKVWDFLRDSKNLPQFQVDGISVPKIGSFRLSNVYPKASAW